MNEPSSSSGSHGNGDYGHHDASPTPRSCRRRRRRRVSSRRARRRLPAAHRLAGRVAVPRPAAAAVDGSDFLLGLLRCDNRLAELFSGDLVVENPGLLFPTYHVESNPGGGDDAARTGSNKKNASYAGATPGEGCGMCPCRVVLRQLKKTRWTPPRGHPEAGR